MACVRLRPWLSYARPVGRDGRKGGDRDFGVLPGRVQAPLRSTVRLLRSRSGDEELAVYSLSPANPTAVRSTWTRVLHRVERPKACVARGAQGGCVLQDVPIHGGEVLGL